MNAQLNLSCVKHFTFDPDSYRNIIASDVMYSMPVLVVVVMMSRVLSAVRTRVPPYRLSISRRLLSVDEVIHPLR